MTVAAGAVSGILPSNGLENGAPDGVRIVNTQTQETVDSLSYEGDIPNVTEDTAEGLIDMGEGGLARCPDGADTDQNAQDFAVTTTLTPGSPNICN